MEYHTFTQNKDITRYRYTNRYAVVSVTPLTYTCFLINLLL